MGSFYWHASTKTARSRIASLFNLYAICNLWSRWEEIVSFCPSNGLEHALNRCPHHLYHCDQTFNLKLFFPLIWYNAKKGIKIIDLFTQGPKWSMRYIIKRRLLIRAEAHWAKCLLQQRGPDQLCCQCSWIGPHMDQCVIEPYGSAHCSLSFCGRLRDWKSDSQRHRHEQGSAIFVAMESNWPTWGLATSNSALVNHTLHSF